jgi:probable rRNA maturation factor
MAANNRGTERVPVMLRVETAAARRYARALRSDAAAAMRAAGLGRAELSLLLVDDAAIRALNRDFRGRDRATDVLSFSQLEDARRRARAPIEIDPDARVLLGDVVISIDTALAQARRAGIGARERLAALLVHGMLHLVGYDHERSPAEARRMHAREREIAVALAARPRNLGGKGARAARARSVARSARR